MSNPQKTRKVAPLENFPLYGICLRNWSIFRVFMRMQAASIRKLEWHCAFTCVNAWLLCVITFISFHFEHIPFKSMFTEADSVSSCMILWVGVYYASSQYRYQETWVHLHLIKCTTTFKWGFSITCMRNLCWITILCRSFISAFSLPPSNFSYYRGDW